MSLRIRLTFLYTSLLGGVLLVFGTLVYGLVTQFLLEQIDDRLSQAAGQLVDQVRINASNEFDVRLFSEYQPTENLVFQVWDAQKNLEFSRPAGLREPLDEVGLQFGQNLFSSQSIRGTNVRVLSVPLRTDRGPAGVLQVGLSIALVEATQNILVSVLIVLAFGLMLLVGWGTWLFTSQALAPLATVTEVATRITQADDLSRRIPISSTREDEVGQLIRAFNETLERLEKLFNTQRRFLADVSHELRTPLTVIRGEVGLIRLTGEIEEESLAAIETEVDRLTRLVGDLLLLAQAESGNLPLEKAPVALDDVIMEVFQQMRVLAAERLTVQVAEIEPLQVMGDRDRLKQVFLNLISNAVNYTPNGGLVSITLAQKGTWAQVAIQDNGPGIPKADLPNIFDRFYRAEKSRKRNKNGGFGLGLSIAHWIVVHHAGKIQVESEEGQGTTFIVCLPVIQPETDE